MIRTKLYLLSAVSLVVLVGLIWLALTHTNRLYELDVHIKDQVETRNKYLNQMLFSIGYGHAIHNFKNLVIRGPGTNNKRLKKLKINEGQFDKPFTKYENLVNEAKLQNGDSSAVNRQLAIEREALKAIEVTLNEYKKAKEMITKLHRNEMSVKKIDEIVIIKDAKAIRAFNNLGLSIDKMRSSATEEKKVQLDKLIMVVLIATAILGVLLACAILLAFQVLRPICIITALVKSSSDTKVALGKFKHPHSDEVQEFIRAIDSTIK